MFDSVDVIFDLPGYIAGYGVSPDSRCNEIQMRLFPRNIIMNMFII